MFSNFKVISIHFFRKNLMILFFKKESCRERKSGVAHKKTVFKKEPFGNNGHLKERKKRSEAILFVFFK